MGYYIKEMRKKRHLTQEELAKKANVSRGTIALLESGKCETTTKTLKKIATALDTTMETLFFTGVVQSTEQETTD